MLEVTLQLESLFAAICCVIAYWKHPPIRSASWIWSTKGGAWLGLLITLFGCGIFVFVAAAVPLYTGGYTGKYSFRPQLSASEYVGVCLHD